MKRCFAIMLVVGMIAVLPSLSSLASAQARIFRE